MFRLSLIGIFIFLFVLPATAQQLLTEREAINSALANNKNIQAAALQVTQQQQLVNGAAGFNNTSLLLERSPFDLLQTSIEQEFEWPTVYGLRKKSQLQRVEVAKMQQQFTAAGITRLIKETFLQVQYLSALHVQLLAQDSLYENIYIAAKRNFEAGQINKLEEQFASNQYYLVHNNFTRNQVELELWKNQLNILMGETIDFTVEPLLPYLFADAGDSISNAALDVLQQQVILNEAELKRIRAENKPDFITALSFPLQTPYQQFLGFRAGLSIPLFGKQNRSRVQAAQTGIEIAKTQLDAQMQQNTWQKSNALQTYLKEKQSIAYYQSALLVNANDIISTAFRLFTAGEISYTEALRNAATGFQIKINYLEIIKNYNQAIIDYKYLTGTL